MIPYIITILFATIIFLLVIGGGKKLRLKVKSASGGKPFTAEKKGTSKGNYFLDWFYYDSDGKSIEDENLKKIIFEAFSDEDWYGAYEFYTKADSNITVTTKPKEETV
jgi:hypothetical protein